MWVHCVCLNPDEPATAPSQGARRGYPGGGAVCRVFEKKGGEGLSGGVNLVVPFSPASADVDLVSFDLFETLLLSPLPGPSQVWEMVGGYIGMPDFALARRAAEAEALRRAEVSGRSTITHDEIYDCLDLPMAPREFAKRTELLYEAALWQPHPELRLAYMQWAEAGRAVIVADTVHDTAFVAGLLARHGLPEAPLFLSSEMAVSKADGRLFAVMTEKLGVQPDRILHLGCRAQEDLRPAAEAGFRTHLVDGRVDIVAPGRSGAAALSYGLRRLAPDARQDPVRSVGFEVLGPLYCGFLRWVEWHARINAIDVLLLLPGIGYGLDRIAPSLGVSALPRRAYLTTSWIALTLAGISERSFDEKVGFLIQEIDGHSASEGLARLGIPVPSEQVMKGLGLGEDVVIGAEHHPLLRRFCTAYRWPILAAARRNRRALFQTLLAHGVTPGARVALVAVDWDGSLQEAFEQAMDGTLEMEVHGYSLCLLDTPDARRHQARMHLKAMLGREGVSGPTLDLLSRRQKEIEALFQAPHGPIIGYDDRAGGDKALEGHAGINRARLAQAADSLAEGAEAFARLFNGFVAATGYEPEPLEIVAPFLEGLADLKGRTALVSEGSGPSMASARPTSGARSSHGAGNGSTRAGNSPHFKA